MNVVDNYELIEKRVGEFKKDMVLTKRLMNEFLTMYNRFMSTSKGTKNDIRMLVYKYEEAENALDTYHINLGILHHLILRSNYVYRRKRTSRLDKLVSCNFPMEIITDDEIREYRTAAAVLNLILVQWQPLGRNVILMRGETRDEK